VRGPGSPGPIISLDATFVNFGELDVEGVDYQLSYRYKTQFGDWTPSVSASETYRYSASLVPGVPATNRLGKASDDRNWAPRWKGTAALDWKLAPCAVHIAGRYVGSYQDYDRTSRIGNFWLVDTNVHYDIGSVLAQRSSVWKGIYLEVGGVNVFNVLPQFSNFEGAVLGYDPTQADIRGRFLYTRLGLAF
jgi:hypothetical protein